MFSASLEAVYDGTFQPPHDSSTVLTVMNELLLMVEITEISQRRTVLQCVEKSCLVQYSNTQTGSDENVWSF